MNNHEYDVLKVEQEREEVERQLNLEREAIEAQKEFPAECVQ